MDAYSESENNIAVQVVKLALHLDKIVVEV